MSDRVFVDTDVLIYAYDVDAGAKHTIAAGLVKDLWTTRLGILSTQVLQEFYVNVTGKIPAPLSRAVARDIVTSYAVWQIEPIDVDRVREASELEERHRLSFRDALILVTARRGGAEKLLSEDLNPGARTNGVRVVNPFSRDPASR